jgi:hypothetical protein
LTTSPPSVPGFFFGTLITCARAPADTNAAAHTRNKIGKRARRNAVRLPGGDFPQFYIEEFKA